jgi:hypothetical protein
MRRKTSAGVGEMRAPVVALAVLSFAVTPRAARAVDPFEIQVYDGTANAPGVPSLELHANHVFDGLTNAEPPELPAHHRTHLTLEPAFGVTPFFEAGAYLQTAFRADGTFDYAGTKLRAKFVTPPGFHPHVRLGANFEIAFLPERYDAARVGTEIRPIAAWENETWLFVVNPILDVPLGGSDHRPELEPAAMAKVKIAGVVAAGLEYYSSLGPISAPSPLGRQEHYLYEAIDLLCAPHFELNAGIGEGLTAGSNTLVAKMILGYAWE